LSTTSREESSLAPGPGPGALRRYTDWFHELDAWTEYWDIYHPETRGRFYFGNGDTERGLLTSFLPREGRPPAFLAWTRMALGLDTAERFMEEVRVPEVESAVLEVDDLLDSLFAKHFGDAGSDSVRSDYLEGMFLFATDALPPASERDARVAESDPRKRTAGRHTLDGDLMWFAWALHTEAAHGIRKSHEHLARHTLLLGGVAMGCSADFAWRKHRRTRSEYDRDAATAALLRERGSAWSQDYNGAAQEVHALYRIREWGHE
jgi:hypothetical protein